MIKLEYHNTKIITTDIKLWKFFVELVGGDWLAFQREIFCLSKFAKGLSVHENGITELKGQYLLSIFSGGTYVDLSDTQKDITEEVIALYQEEKYSCLHQNN